MRFEYTETARYQRRLEDSLRRIIPICSDPLRTGVFCSIGTEEGLVIVTFPLLLPPMEKWEKYHRLVGEKVWRLGQHHDHIMGRESADESLERYAGAFRTAPYGEGGFIIATSGLPLAEEDEAVGMWGLWKMKEIDFSTSPRLSHHWITNGICSQLRSVA